MHSIIQLPWHTCCDCCPQNRMSSSEIWAGTRYVPMLATNRPYDQMTELKTQVRTARLRCLDALSVPELPARCCLGSLVHTTHLTRAPCVHRHQL